MNIQTTRHAQTRLQQRGIPSVVVANIIAWGATRKVPGGAIARFMSKQSLKDVSGSLPKKDALQLDRYKHVYVVMESEHIITVGHQKNRFYR